MMFPFGLRYPIRPARKVRFRFSIGMAMSPDLLRVKHVKIAKYLSFQSAFAAFVA